MNKISNCQKEDGKSYTIGRNAFGKISAVEGISLTKEMQKDFQTFEQKGFSPKSRREAISKKYTR
jgi:hypothetical protein